MDPVSIVGILEGSISLILQCGSAAKSLRAISQKHKRARLVIVSIMQEIDTLELAWSRIKEWSQYYAGNVSVDTDLLERLDRSLENGTVIMTALLDDLVSFVGRNETFTFIQRSKIVWEEQVLQDHQHRIRGQAMAMSLLLQVLNLPTPSERNMMLWISRRAFDPSDESAKSIVPSRLSISTHRGGSRVSIESVEMNYRHLSFENDLFTAHVYKRNYRTAKIHASLQQQYKVECKIDLKKQEIAMGDRAFFYACAVGDVQTVGLLLDNGQDIHARYDSIRGDISLLVGSKSVGMDFQAIHLAASTGNLEIAKTLLRRGANPTATSNIENLSPIHLAARQGDLTMVDFLLRHGVRFDTVDEKGNQAIHLAAWAGSIPVLIRLLHAGASPICRTRLGWRPGRWARKRSSQNQEAYHFLLEQSFTADVDNSKNSLDIDPVEFDMDYIVQPWKFVFHEPAHQTHPSISITTSGPFEQPDRSLVQQQDPGYHFDVGSRRHLSPWPNLPFAFPTWGPGGNDTIVSCSTAKPLDNCHIDSFTFWRMFTGSDPDVTLRSIPKIELT